MLVDPASVRLVRDEPVRPNGTALKIGAVLPVKWKRQSVRS